MAYKKRSDEVAYFLRELESVPYFRKKISESRQKIKEYYHLLSGLARGGEELTEEQKKSSLPMPTVRSEKKYDYSILDKIENEEKKIAFFQKRLDDVSIIEKLNNDDKNAIKRIYYQQEITDDVAYDYGYSRKQLISHLNEQIENLLTNR